MSLTTHSMYQKHILRCLNFSPAALPFGQLWRDPAAAENGFCYIFERPGAYILSVADYHIPRPFSLAFRSHRPTLRFGSLYEGATHYQLDGCRAGSSSPVHFLVREQGIRGKQSWQRGDHCRGIELALSQPYLDSLKSLAAQLSLLDRLPANVTQNVLPPAVVTLLREMAALADTQTLSPLRLEGMVLQCLGELQRRRQKFISHRRTAHSPLSLASGGCRFRRRTTRPSTRRAVSSPSIPKSITLSPL